MVIDDGPLRVINATVGFEEDTPVYIFTDDYVDIYNNECPPPTYSGIGNVLVLAYDIGTTGGSSCTTRAFGTDGQRYVCCYAREYGLMPVYQSIDGEDDKWVAIDGDGNVILSDEDPVVTDAPTAPPPPSTTTKRHTGATVAIVLVAVLFVVTVVVKIVNKNSSYSPVVGNNF